MYNNVKKSVEYLNKKYAELEEHEKIQTLNNVRTETINKSPESQKMLFHCREHGDFETIGFKQTSMFHSQVTAYYECPQGRPAVFFIYDKSGDSHAKLRKGKSCRARRYITDVHLDPYFTESEMVRRERVDFADDMLQPDDPRFKKLYGDPYKRYYEKLEEDERINYERNK